jgi:hypothetical protein
MQSFYQEWADEFGSSKYSKKRLKSKTFFKRDSRYGKGNSEVWSKRADSKFTGWDHHTAKDPTHKWERRVEAKKNIREQLDFD